MGVHQPRHYKFSGAINDLAAIELTLANISNELTIDCNIYDAPIFVTVKKSNVVDNKVVILLFDVFLAGKCED